MSSRAPDRQGMRPFELIERDLETGEREILVAGELDMAVAGGLQAALERASGRQVLVGLEACDFIDSTGIAVIVQASHRAANDGGDGRVVAHSANQQVRRVLEITGLTPNGLVFENREAARSSESGKG